MAEAADPVARPIERKPTVKVGHLRVDEQGEISYKKTPSSTLMASLQLGLSHSIGSLEPKPRRDILMTDFYVIETVEFPGSGSDFTPAHKYKDFTFTTYSPVAFRFFREAFRIKAEDYLLALCHQPLRELSNPGASGSLFYVSADDEFIIKTVQKKEAKFLQTLLQGYYLNLTQNKKTLLPKFFGLYQYRCGGTKIRIVVMNNLLPSSIKYHWKFDLKGSTYGRRASPKERVKKSPTFKDIDYRILLPEGIILSPERYEILNRTIMRDCQVLLSFEIMDYSLLLGVHKVDESVKTGPTPPSPLDISTDAGLLSPHSDDEGGKLQGRQMRPVHSRIDTRKNFSIMAGEMLQSDVEPGESAPPYYPEGYIIGRTEQGEKLLVYLGVIDILQSYVLKKKFEHGLKSLITDGDTVSVHNPSFYAARFQTFVSSEVFKKEKVKIRARRNSTPYKGGSRKGPSQRTPTRERVSRDSDVTRPLSGPEESPVHVPALIIDSDNSQRQNTPPITHEQIQVTVTPENDRVKVKTPEESGNGPHDRSSEIPDDEEVVTSSVTITVSDSNHIRVDPAMPTD